MQRDYWAAFHKVLDELNGPVNGSKTPQPQSWMHYSVGRSNFAVGGVMLRMQNKVRAELYIAGSHAKVFFNQLENERDDIEKEIGYPLDWDKIDQRRDCRIAIYLDGVDPEDSRQWPKQHRWLAERVNDLHRVFAERIRRLDVEEGPKDEDGLD
jgi:hypothetical protein